MTAPAFAQADRPAGAFDVFEFLNMHQRLPRLGDTPAPWRYRGWMLPYVIQLHALIPAVANRWGYHLRTLEAGNLLDQPIPQIHFGEPDNRVFALLRTWSGLIGYDCGGWSDFRSLLDWLAWSMALNDTEPHLSEGVNEKLYRQVDLHSLLQRPYDYPTPHPVAECMIQMTMHDTAADGRDSRLRSCCDPCVGSGRLLLHASNRSLCLWGQDIDPLAIAMCKINGALYAPWMAFPFPASILGMHVKPPPAPLPVKQPRNGRPALRVDDRRQGLLFEP